jgi:hypothetical protein
LAIFTESSSFGDSSLIFRNDAMITKMSSTPRLRRKNFVDHPEDNSIIKLTQER